MIINEFRFLTQKGQKIMDMIEFFADEYKEENWTAFANNFDEVNVHIEEIPQDIVSAFQRGENGWCVHIVNKAE